jgi:hypothetical protein
VKFSGFWLELNNTGAIELDTIQFLKCRIYTFFVERIASPVTHLAISLNT